ncbi:hypothetical protein [Candidatus Pantoea multigeneris]|uniref:Uncharacterized protein n=1 Tax=Candidatus Pantoea multigeneris TaxID=2608357 RepID=A0ABX0RFX3_9GAMM|nr:hypothetical protein [Pantoea multigeneris]NIF23952.1 hypothetical protein [Pantoea multigeneris]
MADVKERIDNLEKTIGELRFDLYASKVAISVLSSVIIKIGGEPDLLINSYEEEKSSAPLVKFNHPEQEGDAEKLKRSVLALLSQKED